MESLKLLTTLFPIALVSGINLYATSLVIGLSIRMGWVQNFPEAFHIFSSTPVLIASGIMFLMEFFADKIQFVDSLWDTIHTFIRPVGASIIVLASLYDIDPVLALIGGLAGGGISLASHTAKAGTRLSINTVSPLENFSNITISFIEDIFVAIITFMALKHPYLTAIISVLFFIFIMIFLLKFFRWLKFMILAVLSRLFFGDKKESDPLPGQHLALVEHKTPFISLKGKSLRVKGAGGRMGYLSLFENFLTFTYSKYFGLWSRIWKIDRNTIEGVYLRKKNILDLIEIHYKNKKGKRKICRFLFFKNREKLLEKFLSFIN